MSAQNSAGIQTLLDSEREAQKIVQKGPPAPLFIHPRYTKSIPLLTTQQQENVPSYPTYPRLLYYPSYNGTTILSMLADRTKRVKDAKTEAQKEIEDYRKQKEEEFKKFEAEHTSGNKKAEEDANKDAEGQLQEIKGSGSKAGDKVVEDLIHAVVNVQPEVPEKIASKA
ncbi:hypothetical protein FQN54_005481 [Arachnomyces sp. PD_36]|nr:hypothetical protein FQN54_005481 [Arachnomyces sp. PD_36]